MIRCIQTFNEEDHQITPVPLSVFIPSTTTTTIIHGEISKQLPSPTTSSSRSTVVRSPSSSDGDSPNEQILTRTLIPSEQLEQTVGENNITQTNQEQINIQIENDTSLKTG